MAQEQTAPKPTRKPESKPVQYDATGRMIRSDEIKSKNPPLPKKKPENIRHTIDTFMPNLIKEEGAYTTGRINKNSIDRGGPTNIGVNEGTLIEYKSWKVKNKEKLPPDYTQNIKKVTPRLARQIYNEMYYKRYNINKIKNQKVAENILDIAINQGITRGGRWYQESLNKKLNLNLKVDGIIGSTTRKALEKAEEKKLLKEIHNEVLNKRIKAYKDLASNKPSQKGFLKGWLNRVETMRWN